MSKEEFELKRMQRNQDFYDQQLEIPALKYYLGMAIFWMISVGSVTFLVDQLSKKTSFDWTALPLHLLIYLVGGFIFGMLFRYWCHSLGRKNKKKMDDLTKAN